MNHFPEASAVRQRDGVEDGEQEGERREEDNHGGGDHGDRFPPHSADHGRPENRLQEGEGHGSCLCKWKKEGDVEEAEVAFHHQPGSDRIKELEYSSDHEDHSYDESAQPSQPEKVNVLHFFSMCSSIISLIFANIASGGSISPDSSEQSILMRSGSSVACRR